MSLPPIYKTPWEDYSMGADLPPYSMLSVAGYGASVGPVFEGGYWWRVRWADVVVDEDRAADMGAAKRAADAFMRRMVANARRRHARRIARGQQ